MEMLEYAKSYLLKEFQCWSSLSREMERQPRRTELRHVSLFFFFLAFWYHVHECDTYETEPNETTNFWPFDLRFSYDLVYCQHSQLQETIGELHGVSPTIQL